MAAKRSMKDKGKDAFSELMGGSTASHDSTVEAHEDNEAGEKTEYIRLNMRVPAWVRDYLQEASFAESTPTRRVSMTGYLVELVEADKKKRGKA